MTSINEYSGSEVINFSNTITGRRVVSPFLLQNAYVIADTVAASAIVVDPGVGCFEPIERILNELCCRLEYIILTHEHYDHIGSINELRAAFECKVVATAVSSSRVTNARQNLSIFYDTGGYVAEPADILICGLHESIPWSHSDVHFFCTPGHTNGCLCVYFLGHLFTGDTLIKGEKTVVKLPGGNGLLLSDSLEFIFSTFSPDTILHPGHGESLLLRNTLSQIHLKTKG